MCFWFIRLFNFSKSSKKILKMCIFPRIKQDYFIVVQHYFWSVFFLWGGGEEDMKEIEKRGMRGFERKREGEV